MADGCSGRRLKSISFLAIACSAPLAPETKRARATNLGVSPRPQSTGIRRPASTQRHQLQPGIVEHCQYRLLSSECQGLDVFFHPGPQSRHQLPREARRCCSCVGRGCARAQPGTPNCQNPDETLEAPPTTNCSDKFVPSTIPCVACANDFHNRLSAQEPHGIPGRHNVVERRTAGRLDGGGEED